MMLMERMINYSFSSICFGGEFLYKLRNNGTIVLVKYEHLTLGFFVLLDKLMIASEYIISKDMMVSLEM